MDYFISFSRAAFETVVVVLDPLRQMCVLVCSVDE